MSTCNLELFDIFSYSCMNCIRSLGYIKNLDAQYKKYGLKTVIVHVPEWGFEKSKSNIYGAAKSQKIRFPVKIDKDKKLINKLKVDFWPSQLLIKNSRVVYRHIGEGGYKPLENAIKKHLGVKERSIFDNEPKYTKFPTIYAGKKKEGKISKVKKAIRFGIVYADGKYKQNNEFLKINGSLTLLAKGKKINFVAESWNKKPVKVNVKANGRLVKTIIVSKPKLYKIAESKSNEVKTLTMATNGNLKVYSFSFE